MLAEKQKKSRTPKHVPEPGDPDRKRVLNVLAQRRYRQRRREKIADLEAKTKVLTPEESPCQSTYPSLESSGDADIEEVTRSMMNTDFPALDFNQDPLDFTLFPDFNFPNLPSPNPPSPDISVQSISSNSTSPPTIHFPITPDGSQLAIPVLSTMRAFSTIATCLDILSKAFDPFYLHTLPATPHPALPPNLHPTTAQIAIPHHPFIDALPWPSIREKLICVFSLPSELRPPIARDDEGDGPGHGLAIMRMAYDIDDYTEGVRVHGNSSTWADGNEMVEEAWEIGECFYRNWWWCMDAKIVESTNRRRRERGLKALTLKG